MSYVLGRIGCRDISGFCGGGISIFSGMRSFDGASEGAEREVG